MDTESKAMLGWLREWIAQGPEANPVALAASLEIVAALSVAAPWEAPKARLNDVRDCLREWFSHQLTGINARALCKQQLYDGLRLVEASWDPASLLHNHTEARQKVSA